MEQLELKPDEHGTFFGRSVRPEVFAELLLNLTSGSEALLASLEWRRRRRTFAAAIDSRSPLARHLRTGYELLIPEWRCLQMLELLIFFHDGSALEVNFGRGDRYCILRRGAGDDDEARKRAVQVRDRLRSQKRRRAERWRSVVVGLLTFLLGAALAISLGLGQTPNPFPASWRHTTTAAVSILAPVYIWYYWRWLTAYRVLPRPNKVSEAWLMMDWSMEDVRRFLTGLAVAFIAGAYGYFLAKR